MTVASYVPRIDALPDLHIKPWRSVVGGEQAETAAFWDKEKQRLLATVGDLTGISVGMNRVLVAVWERPERTGGGIIRPPEWREDRYQGVAGLTLAYGPSAYVSDDIVHFDPSDKPPLHSWVVFRKSDGFRIPIRGAQCVVLDSEKGIKAVIPRPDIVTEG